MTKKTRTLFDPALRHRFPYYPIRPPMPRFRPTSPVWKECIASVPPNDIKTLQRILPSLTTHQHKALAYYARETASFTRETRDHVRSRCPPHHPRERLRNLDRFSDALTHLLADKHLLDIISSDVLQTLNPETDGDNPAWYWRSNLRLLASHLSSVRTRLLSLSMPGRTRHHPDVQEAVRFLAKHYQDVTSKKPTNHPKGDFANYTEFYLSMCGINLSINQRRHLITTALTQPV